MDQQWYTKSPLRLKTRTAVSWFYIYIFVFYFSILHFTSCVRVRWLNKINTMLALDRWTDRRMDGQTDWCGASVSRCACCCMLTRDKTRLFLLRETDILTFASSSLFICTRFDLPRPNSAWGHIMGAVINEVTRGIGPWGWGLHALNICMKGHRMF